MATHQDRSNIDRNSRRIPVCTGIPGLGKLDLATECSTTVLDMTGIQANDFRQSFLLEMTGTHMAKLTSSWNQMFILPGDCSIRFSRRNTTKPCSNAFILGGVLSLLTEFAKQVVSMKPNDLTEHSFGRQEWLRFQICNILTVTADILKLLATSAKHACCNILNCPFSESSLPSARNLTWNQMVSNGMFSFEMNVLDQRKRLGSDITNSDLTTSDRNYRIRPFLNKFKLDSVFGLMSIYSEININHVPDSTHFVSASNSPGFHGSLYDHPGCFMAIDMNSALKTSIKQIFCGTNDEQTNLANKVIEQRYNKRIASYDELESLVSEWGGKLDESARARIKF
ncbi:hypothetical protein BSLG_005950 [Batrachochytrium salamandrivorans]|nr:hypothetical protein BSLG_005950 [Batrachochytrium salamandrivorans]